VKELGERATRVVDVGGFGIHELDAGAGVG
jgi:hypothetical protein